MSTAHVARATPALLSRNAGSDWGSFEELDSMVASIDGATWQRMQQGISTSNSTALDTVTPTPDVCPPVNENSDAQLPSSQSTQYDFPEFDEAVNDKDTLAQLIETERAATAELNHERALRTRNVQTGIHNRDCLHWIDY
jgi:hypothetical protein